MYTIYVHTQKLRTILLLVSASQSSWAGYKYFNCYTSAYTMSMNMLGNEVQDLKRNYVLEGYGSEQQLRL